MRRKNLQNRRKEKLLTQGELAHLTGSTRTQITTIELGKSEPSFQLSMKIAGVLELDVSELEKLYEKERA